MERMATSGTGCRTRAPTLQQLESEQELASDELALAIVATPDSESLESQVSSWGNLKEAWRVYSSKTPLLIAKLQQAGSVDAARKLKTDFQEKTAAYRCTLATIRETRRVLGDDTASSSEVNSIVPRDHDALPESIGLPDVEEEQPHERVEAYLSASASPAPPREEPSRCPSPLPEWQPSAAAPRTPAAAHNVEPPHHAQPFGSGFHHLDPLAEAFQPLRLNEGVHKKMEHPLKTNAIESTHHLDPSTLFLARKEALARPTRVYAGEPCDFSSWISYIGRNIQEFKMPARDVVTYILTNTTGEPHDIVAHINSSTDKDSRAVIDEIYHELRKRFGTNPQIVASINRKIDQLPVIKSSDDGSGLLRLKNVCALIQRNVDAIPSMSAYQSSAALGPLIAKLPAVLRQRIRGIIALSADDGQDYGIAQFGEFIRRQLIFAEANCPGADSGATRDFKVKTLLTHGSQQTRRETTEHDMSPQTRRPTARPAQSRQTADMCIIHRSATHQTSNCSVFKSKPHSEKVNIIRSNNLCYKCLGAHYRRDCRNEVSCKVCGREHVTVMHNEPTEDKGVLTPGPAGKVISHASSLRTRDDRLEHSGEDFSKVLLVDVWSEVSKEKARCYCLIDEQSSGSFIAADLAEALNLKGHTISYTLTTMESYKTQRVGQVIEGLVIQGVGQPSVHKLPPLLTNDVIPGCKAEVATPGKAATFPHTKNYAALFNEIDHEARVQLLVGRDGGALMRTVTYGSQLPQVHHTPLGWALVGSPTSSYDYAAGDQQIVTLRSSISREHLTAKQVFPLDPKRGELSECNTFARLPDDEQTGLSTEDRQFLSILGDGVTVDPKGFLQMPLPFKSTNPFLPDNHKPVFRRTFSTLARLRDDPKKLQQCLDVMGKYIATGQVERVPEDELSPKTEGKTWWLPVFPVVHPKKGKCRLVFDSSAEYKGKSLNSVLLQGPDRNNHLRGVLWRFRNGPVAVAADIEAMFHSFYLPKEHCDFLRFFWFEDNKPGKKLIQMRARVHIFGNKPSPAIANFGMQYAANHDNSQNYPKGKDFILNNFYVDDGLTSTDTVEEAVEVIAGARKILEKFQVRLHKIVSNSSDVLKAFPPSECAMSCSVEIGEQSIQHALGLKWDVGSDLFTFEVNIPSRPFTKRGVVSVVNSLFDPLGFISPIILSGRIIQRQIIDENTKSDKGKTLDWDEPLPVTFKQKWNEWQTSLSEVGSVSVPRSYYPPGFAPLLRQELHVFADASFAAIGYAIYIRSINQRKEVSVALVSGGSKLAPKAATSIPRLELCAALEAAEAASQVRAELRIDPSKCSYYSDSLVTLGYLRNSSRRFSRYVSRRVELVRNASLDAQWSYVSTDDNPADIASRPHTPQELTGSTWFAGPSFLWDPEYEVSKLDEQQGEADVLPEEEPAPEDPKVTALLTSVSSTPVSLHVLDRACERNGSWTRLIKVTKVILSLANIVDRARQRLGVSLAPRQPLSSITDQDAINALIRQSQKEGLTDQSLRQLDPYTDSDGVIRVGGRLRHTFLPLDGRHPVIIPTASRLATILISFFHQRVKHQGRTITLGAVRSAGFHVLNARKILGRTITQCCTCRRLRGVPKPMKMASLPPARAEECPPFTNVGIDIFGPFTVTDGVTTRRTSATKKAWCTIFVCQTTRAIHLELISSMDTNAMQNALRRFLCIRGVCRRIQSDNGTNLMSTRSQIQTSREAFDEERLKNEAARHNCEWTTSPPGASHFNGATERKIASVRRIIDACLLDVGKRAISRDELNTFMQEAASIVNNTPLLGEPCHGDDPVSISPANLTTLKDHPNPPPSDTFKQEDLNSYGMKRWRRVQFIAEQFWKRYRKYYIVSLQNRSKWFKDNPAFSIGDLVLMVEKNTPRNCWPMGRVVSAERSHDGISRVCWVETSSGTGIKRKFRRAANQLVLLHPAGGRSVTAQREKGNYLG